IPTVALLFFSDVGLFLRSTGYAVCAVNGLVVVLLYVSSVRADRSSHITAARSMFRFGAPRVPGDLAFYGLLAAPALAAAHQAGMRTGGGIPFPLSWATRLRQTAAAT